MTSVNRAALLTKMHRVLKKHFKPVSPDMKRPLLEQLLYACCLENSMPEQADEAYQILIDRFFDMNEIRVSSVRELAEVLSMLNDSVMAATRVKGLLQSVFESVYAFDLEQLKKQNIGAAIKQLEKYEGVSSFGLAYATQTALGGHSIPINKGAMETLLVIGALTPEEAAENRVPGLERAISKGKGLEFGSLIHQLGVMFFNAPFSPNLKKILQEIDPDCKDRLPKRKPKKAQVEETPEPAAEETKKETKKTKSKKSAKAADEAKTDTAEEKKTKAPAKKKSTAKKAAAAGKAKKAAKTPAKKKTKTAKKKSTAKKAAAAKITKRKPR